MSPATIVFEDRHKSPTKKDPSVMPGLMVLTQNAAIAVWRDVSNGEIGSKPIQRGENMDRFKIKVARIEMISPNERGEDVSLTFQFEGRQTTFTLPIFLNSCEFDDTEIVKVARSKLH